MEVENGNDQAASDNNSNNSNNVPALGGTSSTLNEELERFMASPVMRITEEERQWAITIKQAVAEDEEVQGLSDLEYVQYAIVTRGNVQDSMRRIRGLQLFRQEYGIHDTLEQGMDMLHNLLHQQPGMLLSVDKARMNANAEDQDLHSHYLMVFDFAKINPKAMKLERDKRDMLGAMYYIHHATQTTPTAMRNGILFIAECEGMSFDNISLDFVGPIWREMKNYYPVYLKEISWLRPRQQQR